MTKHSEENPITFWLEFIKNPYSEDCKEVYKLVPEVKAAKDAFERIKADPEKINLIELREEAFLNYRSDLIGAERRGEERGLRKGKAEGRKEGKEEGKSELVKNMLSRGLSGEQIAQFTGLSVEEIKALQ